MVGVGGAWAYISIVLIEFSMQDVGGNKSQCSSFFLFTSTIQPDLGYDAGCSEPLV
jgi:hypothetical protein